MLLSTRPDRPSRQRLVIAAEAARVALTVVYDASPQGSGVLDIARWDAARKAANPALVGFEQALTDLPRRDRTARRLGHEWFLLATSLLWYRDLGFQTVEDVAYAHVRRLPDHECPPAVVRELRRTRRAVVRQFLEANSDLIDELVRTSEALQRPDRHPRHRDDG